MSDSLTILFVDDEPRVLQGLRRMLHKERSRWQCHFACGGKEALDLLQSTRCDVIISDIRMPGMNGVELLTAVRERYPHMVRIVLSGQASRETVLHAVGPTHRYLPKPCQTESLKAALESVNQLRRLLRDDCLRSAICGLESLPTIPALLGQLHDELQQEEPSVRRIAQIISRDLSMSSRILHVIHSGLLGQRQEASDVAEAVTILGLDVVRPLVLSTRLFEQFSTTPEDVDEMERLWQHSVAVANGCREIALLEGMTRTHASILFFAGLLHDLGKLVLRQIPANESDGAPPHSHLQPDDPEHAAVGAYLLGLWGLDTEIVEAAAGHSGINDGPMPTHRLSVAIVHTAGRYAQGRNVDLPWIGQLGAADKVDAWLERLASISDPKETTHV